MNKKFIIRKNEKIQQVINQSQKKTNKFFVVYYSSNNLNYSRFCISVGKKIGKAHTRNLYKRRIKDILMKNNFNFNFDYVIILRTAILGISYEQMRYELIKLLEGKN